ncbi:MAG: HAMP domain-containing histidine kinase [Eubacterium sp.]|nr:HAMP domain-containing histidine kinase [Eubacterium sp.]
MMIRKLRKKFIMISTFSVIAVLVFVLGGINMVNYYNARVEIFSVLTMISESGGVVPETLYYRSIFGEAILTQETVYSLRFFSAYVAEDGTVHNLNREQVTFIREKEAQDLLQKALKAKKEEGFLRNDSQIFAYQRTESTDGKRSFYVIMDCTRQLRSTNMFLMFSIWTGIIAILLLFLLLTWFSRRAVAPMVRNMEAQKQFITNASHELKTPLAIISANTEVIEMTEGRNEWTESTMEQVSRMSELISHLITLSRLQEKEEIEITQVDFSAVTDKIAEEFRVLAEKDGKEYETRITEGRMVKANETALRELVSILCDNAVKYCTEGGMIRVTLEGKGHGTILTVSNTYPEKEDMDYSRFFERFYREDESHNSEKKGFGIGLSMAEKFVEMFHGKISVHYKDGMIHFVVSF